MPAFRNTNVAGIKFILFFSLNNVYFNVRVAAIFFNSEEILHVEDTPILFLNAGIFSETKKKNYSKLKYEIYLHTCGARAVYQ